MFACGDLAGAMTEMSKENWGAGEPECRGGISRLDLYPCKSRVGPAASVSGWNNTLRARAWAVQKPCHRNSDHALWFGVSRRKAARDGL